MSPKRPEHGFALLSAIFLLVVLTALGGFIATVSTSQHAASALDILSARAYQAARAGTEWGLHRALMDSAQPSTACSAVGVSTDLGQIDSMTVSVSCSHSLITESGANTYIYTITATACNRPNCATADPASPNYVERVITVVADTTPQ